jgi:hypothetical protein
MNLKSGFLVLEPENKTSTAQYVSRIEAERPKMETIILRFGLCLDLGSPVDATGGRVDVYRSLEPAFIAICLFHDNPSLLVYM